MRSRVDNIHQDIVVKAIGVQIFQILNGAEPVTRGTAALSFFDGVSRHQFEPR